MAVKICRATFGAAEAVPTGPEKQTQKRPTGYRVRAEPGCTQEEEGSPPSRHWASSLAHTREGR